MCDKSGIYGYNQKLSQFEKLPKELFLKRVKKSQSQLNKPNKNLSFISHTIIIIKIKNLVKSITFCLKS